MEAIYGFARMGEEVMRYIMGMETELQHTALYSHDMNNDTKSLVQTLQFFQSPLMKNQPFERINMLLKQAEDVAVRLNQTFQLNRDRSSLIMKSIRGEYEKIPIDITSLIKTTHGKFLLLAQKQKVNLIVEIPQKSYVINGNPNDLIRVMDNLIANALRYVPVDGRITFKGQEKEEGFPQIPIRNQCWQRMILPLSLALKYTQCYRQQ